MEEPSFPSAGSGPRWALHMCDNKCREEGYIYQLVATVTEGGKAGAINLCRQCYNARRLQQGERRRPRSGGKWLSRRLFEAVCVQHVA